MACSSKLSELKQIALLFNGPTNKGSSLIHSSKQRIASSILSSANSTKPRFCQATGFVGFNLIDWSADSLAFSCLYKLILATVRLSKTEYLFATSSRDSKNFFSASSKF